MVHIVSAGAWIGVDVVVAVLVLTGWFASDVELHGLAYRALAEFIVVPMLASGFFPPAVSLTALTFAVVLAVMKPWGTIRRSRHRGGGAS